MSECYGGAFDIDPCSYWTRSDLDKLASAIEDLNPDFIIKQMYLKDDKYFEIDFEDKIKNYSFFTNNLELDKRKADTPEKLCKVYAPIIKKHCEEIIEDFLKEMEREP